MMYIDATEYKSLVKDVFVKPNDLFELLTFPVVLFTMAVFAAPSIIKFK